MRNVILLCDCLDGLEALADESIPCTVTSPPYDGVFDYEGAPRFTWNRFTQVAQQLHRITVPGGAVCWVVRDQVRGRTESGTSHRQASYFRSLGFGLLTIHVIATNYRPITGRHAGQHQYAFVFFKGKPRHLHIIRDKKNIGVGDKLDRHHFRERDGRVKPRAKREAAIGQWGQRGNVWSYSVGGAKSTRDNFAFSHPCCMSEELAEDLIVSFSRPGDLVLDPFCGAGTTPKMAVLNLRDYLGFEIVSDYKHLAERRVRVGEVLLRRELEGISGTQ